MLPLIKCCEVPQVLLYIQAMRQDAEQLHLVGVAVIFDAVWPTSRKPHALLINPPGYAPVAFVLLAELHGRIGHFPSLMRLRPKSGPVTTYEVAELLNLQAVRDASRTRR